MENPKTPDIGYILIRLYRAEAKSEYHRECQNFMAKQTHKNHLILGSIVATFSAIVGSAIFISWGKGDNDTYQPVAGILSIMSTVLIGLQSFWGVAKASENHRKTAHSYGTIYIKVKKLFSKHQLHLGRLPDGLTEEMLVYEANTLDEDILNANNIEPIVPDKVAENFKYIVIKMDEWLKGNEEKAREERAK